MPETVLLVDDEKDIVDLLKYNLEREGYRVLTAHSGSQALRMVKERPDVCVLDVMMPDLDGWEVCKAIRKDEATAHIPVIFLTAKGSEGDEVLGLELGANDYITKPVRLRTFLARVKKVLQSAAEKSAQSGPKGILTVGKIRIHVENYRVEVGKREIALPKKEFEVLLFLARHPDRVISRSTLLNEVWGQDVYVVDRTIDVHIRKIREKLEEAADQIETVKGVGYRLRRDG
jgi:two-component system alkaline phosphatase synthesis response regulator PhoP